MVDMTNKIWIIVYILFIVLALIINSLLVDAIDKTSDVNKIRENIKVLPYNY
jgi:hypothetical protein